MRKPKSTSRYTTNDATLREEIAARKHMADFLEVDYGPNGEPPYAIAYGFCGADGTKKLLKRCPVFYSDTSFDAYVKKHKQIVLAVYKR